MSLNGVCTSFALRFFPVCHQVLIIVQLRIILDLFLLFFFFHPSCVARD